MPNDDQNLELKSRLENYKDVEGTSTKELNFGLWFIANKHKFRLAFIYCLSVIAAVSWLISLYGFAYYVFWGMKQDETMVRQMVETSVNYSAVKKNPQNLIFSNVEVIRSTGKSYDFLVKISNLNTDFWGDFEYYFLTDEGKTGGGKSFILPKETKYLAAFNQSYGSGSDVRLIIENMQWRRINKHNIPDWNEFSNDHLKIAIEDIRFAASGDSSGNNLNQLIFTAINKTAYNFKEADFLAVLSGGSRIVGVNKYKFNDFLSNEKREFRGNWPGSFGRVEVEIFPEINIMDANNYRKFEL